MFLSYPVGQLGCTAPPPPLGHGTHETPAASSWGSPPHLAGAHRPGASLASPRGHHRHRAGRALTTGPCHPCLERLGPGPPAAGRRSPAQRAGEPGSRRSSGRRQSRLGRPRRCCFSIITPFRTSSRNTQSVRTERQSARLRPPAHHIKSRRRPGCSYHSII
jgi:hypothetical protein